MIEFIQGEFRKIILDCCKRHGDDHALILGLDVVEQMDDEGQKRLGLSNTYNILPYHYDYDKNEFVGFHWEKINPLSINQVLGVKIDILGYGSMSEPFIGKSILRFSEKHKIEPFKVSIFCLPTLVPKTKKIFKGEIEEIEYVYNSDGNPKMIEDVSIYLYHGRNPEKCIYLETITFSDLFSEEDLMTSV